MSISISNTMTKIGVESSRSKLEIKNTHSQLSFTQKHGRVNIHTEQLKVKIDQSPSFSSSGLKNYREISEEASADGRSAVLNYIAQVVSEGETLADITGGGNVIASIALSNSNVEHVFDIDTMPKVKPNIDFVGSVEISADNNLDAFNGVEHSATKAEAVINYTPSQVRVFISQYGKATINFVGNNIDSSG